jgi:hypothetical protein
VSEYGVDVIQPVTSIVKEQFQPGKQIEFRLRYGISGKLLASRKIPSRSYAAQTGSGHHRCR